MRQVYKIDSNGFYVEPVILQDDESTPGDCLEVIPPEGFVKLQWNGTQWVEGMDQAELLPIKKEAKKIELNANCDNTIMAGFSSNALGVAHTYSSLALDEIWFNATLHRFNIDPNFTSVNYKTLDAGYLVHTKEQFMQVFIDGHSFGDSQITKLNNLKTQVDSAQTVDEVESIVW